MKNVIKFIPISYTYFESDLIEPITPNKLLYGRNLDVINIVNNAYPTVEVKVTKREQYIQTLLKHFWSRWTSEYLTELREHQKRKSKNKTVAVPKVGDVVLIKDENYKRSDWKIGRITELLYSKDNQVRAAKVNVVSNKKVIALKVTFAIK